jgi:hypothetical protein
MKIDDVLETGMTVEVDDPDDPVFDEYKAGFTGVIHYINWDEEYATVVDIDGYAYNISFDKLHPLY